jgi:uncharacterized protein
MRVIGIKVHERDRVRLPRSGRSSVATPLALRDEQPKRTLSVNRLLIWTGERGWAGAWRTETAQVALDEGALRAIGTQVATDPVPYQLDYRLDASGEGFVTRSLRIVARGEGWERRLHLERHPNGDWSADVDSEGKPDLPASSADVPDLGEALDCDLGFSPLTNTMPVLRHDLHRHPGRVEFVMAWVSVPDLGVHASHQLYEHVHPSGDGATVKYASVEDGHEAFTADLELDGEGLVRRYPGLAQRVTA